MAENNNQITMQGMGRKETEKITNQQKHEKNE